MGEAARESAVSNEVLLTAVDPPPVGTVEQMFWLFAQHMRAGKAKYRTYVDQRGLSYLEPKHHGRIGLAIPPDGETHDDKTERVFLQARF